MSVHCFVLVFAVHKCCAPHARGLICLAMDDAMIDKLELPMMVRDNQASLGTAFTVSIEARHGVSTGISARDRATTIRAAIADDTGPHKIVSPGHVFPLRARKGGVLVRTGQTEGSVDLARLAGLKPAGVICEIMRDDGEMASRPELEEFARKHGLLLLSVADIIAYRLQRERIVRCQGTGTMRPGALGPGEPFIAHYYETPVGPLAAAEVGSSTGQHLLIVVADVAGKSVPAALLMATFQASLHSLAADELPLPELIVRLNRYASAHSFGGLRFTTAFMAELELDTRILTYVNAGHNAPFLMRTGGDIERLVTGGVPLGIDPVALYESGRVSLHPGDRLLVFSDGVVESQNRREEEYGEERLLGIVQATAGLIAQGELNRILESVDEFVGNAPRYDDTTLLVLHLVETRPAGAGA